MPIIADAPTAIDGLASAASVLLIIELSLIIILLAALMLLLAYSLKWLHDHVIPPIHEYLPAVRGALGATDRTAGRVVDLVASLYARRRGVETGVRSIVDTLLPTLEYIFGGAPAPSNGHTPQNGHASNGHHAEPAATHTTEQTAGTPPNPAAWDAPTAARFDPFGDTIVMRRQPPPASANDEPTQPQPPEPET